MIEIVAAAVVFIGACVLAWFVGRGELRGGHGKDDR